MADETPTGPERPEPRIGSYRLVRPLGSGGMSSVFQAVHTENGSTFAVKILPRTLARNRTLLQRFLREAKSAEALEHPTIVAIFDHGVDNGQYYLVLEFVDGGDLHDWVRANGPMPAARAIAVTRSVCEGLRFAARQGLIHRDIKPANLLMSSAGEVKIADLGLALHAAEEDERMTREGTTVGTVDYMSPEQARDSRGTSERSDIYSLGCTLFFLLTGQPPFVGGDITEKLTRHFTAPPPDPRTLRADVPEGLSLLVRKMMAKRPEARPANYDELIAALDALANSDPSATPSAAPGALTALFDDEDDSEPQSPNSPSAHGGAAAKPTAPPLVAMFDDEDDDVAAPPSGGHALPTLPETSRPAKGRTEERTADVSMADLAALVAEGDREPAVRRPGSVAGASPPGAKTPTALFDDENEDDDAPVVGHMPAQIALEPGWSLSPAEKSWLVGITLGAVALIVGVIGFHRLFKAATSDEPPPKVAVEKPDEPVVDVPEPVVAVRTPTPTPAPAKPKGVAREAETSKKAKPPRPDVVWIEPIDAHPDTVAETTFEAGVEAKFLPDWATESAAARPPGTSLSVRRLASPNDPEQKANLGAAIEAKGVGTINMADDGPFFETELHVRKDGLLVRARAGFRPIVVLGAPRLARQEQKAYVDVADRSLTLEGIDLIADMKDLPRSYESLFLCRGGSLTLRDCTVTIVNRPGARISLVHSGKSETPSRVRLERTLVRGAFTSLVDMGVGPADVVVSRSMVVNGRGAVATAAGAELVERRLFFRRSLLACRGPAIELADPPRGVRPKALILRAIGSTFAHLAAPTPISLMEWRGAGARIDEMVVWNGQANEFAGWSDWLSVGDSHTVRIDQLAAARAVWTGTDESSRESTTARPFALNPETSDAASLQALAPERRDVLSRLPIASPLILEKTIEPFPRPVVPGLTSANGTPLPAPPIARATVSHELDRLPPEVRINFIKPPAPKPTKPATSAKPVAGVRELTFDAEAAAWSGDLGRFLAESVKRDDTLVKLAVKGSGSHVWTPVKLPEGVSLEITVAPDTGGREPSWTVAPGASGGGLIEVRGGSLVLTGVNLSREGASKLKRFVRVEGGHLIVQRVRFLDRGKTEGEGGGLIAFAAPGSRPLKPALEAKPEWPFETPVDRPTCRVTDSVLVSQGEILSAEIGRGLAAFSQSVIVSGTSAFNLRPGLVARRSLEADLWLDHCTLTAERSFVALGSWRGSEPGPDRPWLVSTRHCAFFGIYQKPARGGVLIRADADAFAHGALFWQGDGDAFEVPHFAVANDATPAESRRPDVVRDWIELWGRPHLQKVTGPRAPLGVPTRRPVVGALRPGKVEPGDLAIDRAYPPKESPPKDLGVDFARLGLTPSTPPDRMR